MATPCKWLLGVACCAMLAAGYSLAPTCGIGSVSAQCPGDIHVISARADEGSVDPLGISAGCCSEDMNDNFGFSGGDPDDLTIVGVISILEWEYTTVTHDFALWYDLEECEQDPCDPVSYAFSAISGDEETFAFGTYAEVDAECPPP